MNEATSVRAGMAWTRDVLTQWRSWTKAHLGTTILLSALAFAFGWLWNTYIMAVNLEGYAVGPDERTIATAEGHAGNGLFWLLFFSLLSGLATYGWQRGWKNLWADLATIPRRFGETMSQSRSAATAMLLWGVSISLVISTLISSAVSLALGLVLLTLAATPIGTILNFALIRLWKALCGIATPKAGVGAVLLVGPFMVMIGEALGLFVDWLIGSWLIGLILGLVSAIASVILARGVSATKAAVVLFGLTLGLSNLRTRAAWADDGGWNECVSASGEPCSDLGLAGVFAWFGSEGAGAVLANAAVGGTFAGVGAALGVGLGSVAASLAVAAAQAASVPGQRSAGAGRHAAEPAQAEPAQAEQVQDEPVQAEPPQADSPADQPWQAAA
ncbi:MAG TPA: hypothetical protein DGT23_28925, partial [Micromonosporaceae bacterium]|nr:hypothetical protein [Micromonosporaceae bacterium]